MDWLFNDGCLIGEEMENIQTQHQTQRHMDMEVILLGHLRSKWIDSFRQAIGLSWEIKNIEDDQNGCMKTVIRPKIENIH